MFTHYFNYLLNVPVRQIRVLVSEIGANREHDVVRPVVRGVLLDASDYRVRVPSMVVQSPAVVVLHEHIVRLVHPQVDPARALVELVRDMGEQAC